MVIHLTVLSWDFDVGQRPQKYMHAEVVIIQSFVKFFIDKLVIHCQYNIVMVRKIRQNNVNAHVYKIISPWTMLQFSKNISLVSEKIIIIFITKMTICSNLFLKRMSQCAY